MHVPSFYIWPVPVNVFLPFGDLMGCPFPFLQLTPPGIVPRFLVFCPEPVGRLHVVSFRFRLDLCLVDPQPRTLWNGLGFSFFFCARLSYGANSRCPLIYRFFECLLFFFPLPPLLEVPCTFSPHPKCVLRSSFFKFSLFLESSSSSHYVP